MPGPYEQERIENWVADFLGGEAARRHGGGVHEFAGPLLTTLLSGACDERGRAVDEIEEPDLRAALLGPVAALDLPGSVRDAVPDLAADLLADLEEQGRVGGGRALGLFVRALRPVFRDAAAGRGTTIRRPAAKLRPNDPCPCGSGQKWKRCCRGGPA